ncbi:MAG: class I SAM-dependent methyltransferase [Gemmatimonadaceae bacterium]|nr:class I SAM-dependent methyltransferase [Gemmatimonadaceae bacterium]
MPAHVDRGLRRVLERSLVYSAFQRAMGAEHMHAWVLQEGWRVRNGMRVVDIGCGPGDVLDRLPPVEYVGVDINPDYIAEAQRANGARATFVAGTASALLEVPQAYGADLVTCLGVLHHLTDAQTDEVLMVARRLLRPGGRFVALEPTWLAHQSGLSRWIMSKDRGQAIRSDDGWRALLAPAGFARTEARVVTHLLRVPYVHVLLEGVQGQPPT